VRPVVSLLALRFSPAGDAVSCLAHCRSQQTTGTRDIRTGPARLNLNDEWC